MIHLFNKSTPQVLTNSPLFLIQALRVSLLPDRIHVGDERILPVFGAPKSEPGTTAHQHLLIFFDKFLGHSRHCHLHFSKKS